MEQAIISGVTHDTSEAKVTIRDVPDRPGRGGRRCSRGSPTRNVNVDMIIQNVSEDGHDRHLLHDAEGGPRPRAPRRRGGRGASSARASGSVDESIAKVSLVGAGMKTHPGVAAQMFRALADAGVNLDMISTSSIRITLRRRGRRRSRPPCARCTTRSGSAEADVTAESLACGDRRELSRWPGTERCPRAPSSPSPAPPARSASRCSRCSSSGLPGSRGRRARLVALRRQAPAVRAAASSRSSEMTAESFDGVDIALFSAGAGI